MLNHLDPQVFLPDRKTCVCIGMFDGVHLGHQKLIQETVKSAREMGQSSVLLTFQSNPKLLQNATHPLTSLPEKIEIIKKLGIDCMVLLPFPGTIGEMKPADFIDKILLDGMHSSSVFVGKNFRFGCKRSGNSDDLRYLGANRNLNIHIQDMSAIEGKEISSTFCRYLIDAREMEKANAMLGYPYFITGTVIEGHGRGKGLGLPTINLKESYPEKIKPSDGVFITKTCIEGKIYSSLTIKGPIPSFNQEETSLETLILDFKRSVYQKKATVFFFSYLRDIQKFSEAGLIRQIEHDKLKTIEYYGENTLPTKPYRFKIPEILDFLKQS